MLFALFALPGFRPSVSRVNQAAAQPIISCGNGTIAWPLRTPGWVRICIITEPVAVTGQNLRTLFVKSGSVYFNGVWKRALVLIAVLCSLPLGLTIARLEVGS